MNTRKKLNIVALFLIFSFFSCNKDKPKQYSYWKVDGREYASNNIEANIGHAIAVIGSKDPADWFKLTFFINYYPETGRILLKRDNMEQHSGFAVLSFFVCNRYYGIDNDTTYIQASTVNGKARYMLPASWYAHYENNIKDSVLIEAIINEP